MKCSCCKKNLPRGLDYFYESNGFYGDGLKKECKKCCIAKAMKYYFKNRKRLIQYSREYYRLKTKVV